MKNPMPFIIFITFCILIIPVVDWPDRKLVEHTNRKLTQENLYQKIGKEIISSTQSNLSILKYRLKDKDSVSNILLIFYDDTTNNKTTISQIKY